MMAVIVPPDPASGETFTVTVTTRLGMLASGSPSKDFIGADDRLSLFEYPSQLETRETMAKGDCCG